MSISPESPENEGTVDAARKKSASAAKRLWTRQMMAILMAAYPLASQSKTVRMVRDEANRLLDKEDASERANSPEAN